MAIRLNWVMLGSLATCIACHSGLCRSDEETGMSVTVVMSNENAAKMEVFEGFKQYLSDLNIQTDYNVIVLGKENIPEELHSHSQPGHNRLFLTLDTQAAEITIKQQPGAPVIAALILNTIKTDAGSNVTGVFLNHPINEQLTYLSRILPAVKRVGILYNPMENLQFVLDAQDLTQERSINLVLEEVIEPRNLPQALRSIGRNAQMIWGIPDRIVLTPETAQHLLVYSFRNRIPLSGLSKNWVKAGALYALDRDYNDIGSQCGEIAIKSLEGISLDKIPFSAPRKVVYMLNLKTARHMKVDLSPEIIAGAAMVFE